MDKKEGDEESHLEETARPEDNSQEVSEGQTPSISANEQDDNVKNRTVKEIIDEVLNCTVIHVPNQQPAENTRKNNKTKTQSRTKIVTVKEILGEILQYNVYNRFDSVTSFAYCNCGCDIPPYAPSTSAGQKIRSDLDISLTRDAPIYEPFQVFSSSMIQNTGLKKGTLSPRTLSLLLPTYSTVLKQGPPLKIKSAESFVPRIPPPSYAEVEGLWDDVPSNVSSDSIIFGPDPLYLICPVCRVIVLTQVTRERSAVTHWIALILCLFLCWPCCLLPYYMKSCSYTYHTCPNCSHYFGMYNPF